MQIVENFPLAKYTTFYIGGPCRYLIFAQTNEEIVEGINFAKGKNLPFLILGGGSNMLVSDKGFDGVVIRVETIGMDIAFEDDEIIELRVASGEVWDDVVRFAVEQEWWGIENLSHIPGFTGAVAVQNVGAYGQEANQVIKSVEVFDTRDAQIKELKNSELNFTYRHSIFNTTERERYVILSITLTLRKQGSPNLSYGDLAEKFAGQEPAIDEVRQAVINIRNLKFPFPDSPEKGNSGSFFRGSLLSEKQFRELKNKLANDFGAAASERLERMSDRLKVPQGYKTPTAFLLELCDLKSEVNGGAKINPSQPAVIVNFTGQATSSDVLGLYKQVKMKVWEKTGIELQIEPDLIGFNNDELAYFSVK